MIQLSRMADYAVLVMAHLARDSGTLHSATNLADITELSVPTVSKVLKKMAKDGILISERGVNGGYRLARAATCISVSDIVQAIDGPVALARCQRPEGCDCAFQNGCITRLSWHRLNNAVEDAFASVSLADLATPDDCPTSQQKASA